MTRKRRTREHIIADYSAIHFEQFALDCGYSVERTFHDYGVDLVMYTYDANGEQEAELIRIQLKATDNPRYVERGSRISAPIESADLEAWYEELFPVILVLYDAQKKIAYWLYVQEYLKNEGVDLQTTRKTINVHFDCANVLDALAVKQFALWKNRLHVRFQKVTKDHDA